MGIFDGWIMVSDIDGTLIGDDCVLNEKDIEAVSHFTKEGGTFVLATGRSTGSAKRFYDQLGLSTPMIANNGTVVRDFSVDRLTYTDFLDDNAADLVSYVYDNYPEAGIEVYGEKEVFFLRHNQMVDEHIARESLPLLDETLLTVPKPWSKILFAIDPPLMDSFRAFIATSPFKNDFFFAQSAPFFYEASKLNASKGKAVSHVVSQLGFSCERLITIGDNENDVKMLSLTPHSFAVNNATEYAKEAAKYITRSSGAVGGAVAEAITLIQNKLTKEE